jgi:O-antigen ligase
MNTKNFDKSVTIILFLILLTAPTQYAFNIANAHLSLADPLIWLAGLMFCISAVLTPNECNQSLGKRILSTLKEILPLPENILFVLLITLSLFKSGNRLDTAKELFQIIEYVLVAFVLFSKIHLNDDLLRKLGIVFLFLISIVVSVAVFQYFDSSRQIMGIKGTFGNRNTYGGCLAVSLPMVLAIILLVKKWWVKIWGAVILASAGITILSGGAAAALLFACSFICVFVSLRSFAIWVLLLFIAGIFIMPILPRDNMEVLKKSIALYDDNAQIESRYTEWQASVQMWQEDPLLGVGLGNYQSEIGMNYGFLTVKEGPKEHDHNNLFLVFASSTGFFGLLGLLTMLLFWFKRTIFSFFACKSESYIFSEPCVKSGVGATTPEEERRGCVVLTPNEQKDIPNKNALVHKILALGAMGAIVAFCITSIWTALLIRGVFLLFIIIVALAIGHNQTACRKIEK